ncbi:MAG: regulatory protein RecX [bacterium]
MPASLAADLPPAAWLERALRLLDQRAHAEGELARKLRQRGCPPAALAWVIAELHRLRLLDDAAFARTLAGEKTHWGQGRVVRELRRRGVAPELAAAAAPDPATDPDARAAELARAAAAARRKWASLAREPDRFTARNKLFRFLAARGFAADCIRATLAQLESEG